MPKYVPDFADDIFVWKTSVALVNWSWVISLLRVALGGLLVEDEEVNSVDFRSESTSIVVD